MADKPSLRIVEQNPWSDPRSYRADPIGLMRDRLNRPTILEHLVGFFASPFGFGAYLGFVAGALFTVAAAIVWTFA